jgi:hypothetical protein
MKTLQSLLAISVTSLLLAHCGGNSGTGFYATGSVLIQFTDGAMAPFDTGLRFTSQMRVDPTLPAGRSAGVIGSCAVGPNSRTVELDQLGGEAIGFKSITVTMPDWSQDSCTNCQHGTVQFVVGSTMFTGTEMRTSAAPAQCQFNATRRGSYGMDLTVSCAMLDNNGKRATLNTQLSLDSCNGSMTRN